MLAGAAHSCLCQVCTLERSLSVDPCALGSNHCFAVASWPSTNFFRFGAQKPKIDCDDIHLLKELLNCVRKARLDTDQHAARRQRRAQATGEVELPSRTSFQSRQAFSQNEADTSPSRRFSRETVSRLSPGRERCAERLSAGAKLLCGASLRGGRAFERGEQVSFRSLTC